MICSTNKIALDCRLVSSKVSGISRFSLKFTDFIIEKFGAENIILIVNDRINSYSHIKQVVTILKPFNFYHWLCFPKFVEEINATHYLSFHYSGLSRKLSNVKTAVTVHDLMYEIVPSFFGSWLKGILGRAYYGVIVGRSIANSDLVLTVSETSKADLLRIFSAESENVSEGMFLGLDEKEGFYKALSVSTKSYFLYVGNGRPHKNIEQLKRVFSHFRKSNKDTYLIIVGHKGDKADGIIYPGFITDPELVNLYKNAKAFVFPSLYEGFGLPIIESLTFNCPVIASDIVAFKEFEHNNIKYFNVNNDQALLDIMCEEQEFDIKTAEIVLKRYSWENIKEKLYKAIDIKLN